MTFQFLNKQTNKIQYIKHLNYRMRFTGTLMGTFASHFYQLSASLIFYLHVKNDLVSILFS